MTPPSLEMDLKVSTFAELFGAVIDNLAACIQVLRSAKRNTGELAVRGIAVHNGRRVEVGNAATKRADPLHLCVATNDGALSVEG